MAQRKPLRLDKPARPVQTTDTGPDTPAQRDGAVYEVPRGAPPGDVRRRRQHPLESMAQRGMLSGHEADRGIAALNLYCATQRGGGPLREYVQRSPQPDMAAVLRCHAQDVFARAVQWVAPRHRPVFDWVVLDGRPLSRFRNCKNNRAERHRQLVALRAAIAALAV